MLYYCTYLTLLMLPSNIKDIFYASDDLWFGKMEGQWGKFDYVGFQNKVGWLVVEAAG